MMDKRFYAYDGVTGTYYYESDGRQYWSQKINEVKNSSEAFAIHFYINPTKANDIIQHMNGNYFISWNGGTSHQNLYVLDKKTAVQFRLSYDLGEGTYFNSEKN